MPQNWFESPWFESPLGARLLRTERHVAGELLSRVFGDYLLQYGYWGSRGGFLGRARTRQRLLAAMPGATPDIRTARPLDKPDIWAGPQRLPFASDSLDALILPHTLEFTAVPHELLREAERILNGEGRLLILGFNPWGLCGLRSSLSRRNRFPWQGKMISERRLCDWLRLLGMDILTTRRYFFRPPLSYAGLLERTRWLEKHGNAVPFMGCGYAVLAGKRLFSANPLQRGEAKQRRGVGALANPIARRNS